MRAAGKRRQAGFTVLEIAVALTVLSAGSAVLWYGLRSSAQLDKLNRLHHAAALLARSDLENLRCLPKQDIHDTLYQASGAGGESLLLVRRVMDSARIVNTLPEIVLDEKLSPKELNKPLEVRVKVWRMRMDAESGAPAAGELRDPEEADGSATAFPGDGAGKPSPLAVFILKLPEYQWY